jgi:archaetidylinositol phosphate synthase
MNAQSVATRDAVGFQTARRINQSLTASIEKRALLWMAERAPGWLSSDQLTLLGLGAQVAAGIFYALSRYQSLRAATGDSVHRAQLAGRQHGWNPGPSAPPAEAALWLLCGPHGGHLRLRRVDGGLGCSGLLHWPTAIAMLIAFLILSSESYLATYTLSCFQLSQGIFGPTEIRILLIAGNLAALRSPYATLFGHRMLLFDLGGIIAAVCMSAMAPCKTACSKKQRWQGLKPVPYVACNRHG